ncbi:tRNA lysidine(34) synthetase TilS [Martelella lutilitoris]|uniref:tRNA(Ile)-lysidine synthase n=1 Tax=Martelella lutilitoris TaxID=2583532 RepID=A0A7T7HMF8_9HYPH|nr:tRNA lysidine(34) synthetase TilS [Martelella lutilitoris]QQM31814.1 tRNA lysidine(34) synthetase TilS [Martelella lutilitoris]
MLTPAPAAVSSNACAVEAVARQFLLSLKKDCHLLVAVSGGGDSIGLLTALDEARRASGREDVRLSAATVDHALRAAAAEEAAWVETFCAARGIAHATLRWTGEKPASGLMAAARDARYRLLAGEAKRLGAHAIALAHTMEDQAETLAMRRARNGSALASGMAERTLVDAAIWVVRPFLRVRRGTIRAFLDGRGLCWIDDPSNEDARFERVRVRRMVRDRVEALAGEAESAARVRRALSQEAASLFASAATLREGVLAELDARLLTDAPAPARYLLNLLIPVLGGLAYGPGGAALERAMALCAGPHGARMTAGRCLLEKHRDALFVVREGRDLGQNEIPPGRSVIWDGRFRIENRSSETLRVAPAGVDAASSGAEAFLPRRLARLAGKVRPALPPFEVVSCTPFLAPFDRFLPGFELALANAIAAAFARPAYPDPAPAYLR